MRSNRRLAATAILASAVLALSAGPAAADCEPAGPIERVLPKADIAFVGTVRGTDGPVATFAVSEVWAGVVEGEAAGGVSVPPALLLAGLVVLLVAGASAFAFRRR